MNGRGGRGGEGNTAQVCCGGRTGGSSTGLSTQTACSRAGTRTRPASSGPSRPPRAPPWRAWWTSAIAPSPSSGPHPSRRPGPAHRRAAGPGGSRASASAPAAARRPRRGCHCVPAAEERSAAEFLAVWHHRPGREEFQPFATRLSTKDSSKHVAIKFRVRCNNGR